MRQIRHWLLALSIAALGLVALFAVACGDDEGEKPEATPTEQATDGTPMADGDHEEPEALHIELSEWSITGEDGGPIPGAIAGEVTFEVHNEGEAPHELVIIKTDRDPADLPVSGTKVDEEAAGEEIGEVEEFPGGEIEVQPFELEAGTYALICNIAGHYEQGMYAQLVVE